MKTLSRLEKLCRVGMRTQFRSALLSLLTRAGEEDQDEAGASRTTMSIDARSTRRGNKLFSRSRSNDERSPGRPARATQGMRRLSP